MAKALVGISSYNRIKTCSGNTAVNRVSRPPQVDPASVAGDQHLRSRARLGGDSQTLREIVPAPTGNNPQRDFTPHDPVQDVVVRAVTPERNNSVRFFSRCLPRQREQVLRIATLLHVDLDAGTVHGLECLAQHQPRLASASVRIEKNDNTHESERKGCKRRREKSSGTGRSSAGVSPAVAWASCPRPLVSRLGLLRPSLANDRSGFLPAGAGRSRHSGRDARATNCAPPVVHFQSEIPLPRLRDRNDTNPKRFSASR